MSSAVVTVVVMTYNHERFIAQALESVLGQQAEFPIEIIVTEDRSTDSTSDIVAEYEQRHPNRIRAIRSPANLNDNSVLTRALNDATGKYIALLDGDDWWSSPSKLAIQVAALERNPNAALCFHDVTVVYEGGEVASHPFYSDESKHGFTRARPESSISLHEIVGGNFIQTCSVVFRREALPPLPAWYTTAALGDWPLYAFLLKRGAGVYLDEALANYRVHSNGLWSSRLSRFVYLQDVEALILLTKHLVSDAGVEYRDAARPNLASLHLAAARAAWKERLPRTATAHFIRYARAVRGRGVIPTAARTTQRAILRRISNAGDEREGHA